MSLVGLAQVNEIDMSTPEPLAKTVREVIKIMTIGNYLKYILRTVVGSGSWERIK